MKNYTIETLKKANLAYDFGIDNEDVAKVNNLIKIFSEQQQTPRLGDTVIIEHPEKGILYENAVIEGNHLGEKSNLSVCTQPSSPHITENFHISVSGGYFAGINAKDLIYVRTDKRIFWMWGKWGSWKSGGGIYFELPVKIWKIKSSKFY